MHENKHYIFYNLIPSFLVAMARHAQIAKITSLQYLCHISRKRGGIEFIFLHTGEHWTFPFDNIRFGKDGQSCQRAQNNKCAKSLQYLKNGQLCWLSYVMGITFYICQSNTIPNYYSYLKNGSRDKGRTNNFILFWDIFLLGVATK